jgi:hypothetical protein
MEWLGKWWLFYADTQLSNKNHLRNVKVTELHFEADGSIRTVDPYTSWTPTGTELASRQLRLPLHPSWMLPGRNSVTGCRITTIQVIWAVLANGITEWNDFALANVIKVRPGSNDFGSDSIGNMSESRPLLLCGISMQ